jgi:hypothetical protein
VPFLPPDFEETRQRTSSSRVRRTRWPPGRPRPTPGRRDRRHLRHRRLEGALEQRLGRQAVRPREARLLRHRQRRRVRQPAAFESVERGWQKIRARPRQEGPARQLPQGIKDANEFFQEYDWAAFHVLLKKAGEPKRNYPRLDLTSRCPPTDWVVEDLLVASEATVLAGDGGVGKSFHHDGAALASPTRREDVPRPAVKKHGPVLYVDEENSASSRCSASRARLRPEEALPNLEYLWYAGVDLLNEPEKLLEEAAGDRAGARRRGLAEPRRARRRGELETDMTG